jgi:hypothetical protein
MAALQLVGSIRRWSMLFVGPIPAPNQREYDIGGWDGCIWLYLLVCRLSPKTFAISSVKKDMTASRKLLPSLQHPQGGFGAVSLSLCERGRICAEEHRPRTLHASSPPAARHGPKQRVGSSERRRQESPSGSRSRRRPTKRFWGIALNARG